MSVESDIRDKLAKLLRLAKNASATPAEAVAAAQKAQEIADAHRIDLASVMTDEQRSEITHEVIRAKNTASWREQLVFVVCVSNGCISTYRVKQNYFTIYGHPEDVKVVGYLVHHLETILDAMSTRDYQQAALTAQRSWYDAHRLHAPSYKGAWCYGAVMAIAQRLDDGRIDLSQSAKHDGPKQYGLVPVTAIEAYKCEIVPHAKTFQSKAGQSIHNVEAYRAGYQAGKHIQINRAVAAGTKALTGG